MLARACSNRDFAYAFVRALRSAAEVNSRAARVWPAGFSNQPTSYSDSAKSLFSCGEKFFSAAAIQSFAAFSFLCCSAMAAFAYCTAGVSADKLEFRKDRIDHVVLPLEQIGEQNLVLNQLRRFALEFGGIRRQKFLETISGFAQFFCRNGISARLKRAFQNFGIKVERA